MNAAQPDPFAMDHIRQQQAPQPYVISVEAYHQMGEAGVLKPDEHVQLLEGRIYQMAPIGSLHADWVNRLARAIIRVVSDDITVNIQNPVRLDDESELEPDLALLYTREQSYAERHPGPEDVALVIEVSDSSLKFDRETKLPLYARSGIPEVWLFDIRQDRVEVYRNPAADGYKLCLRVDNDETLTLPHFPEFSFDLKKVF